MLNPLYNPEWQDDTKRVYMHDQKETRDPSIAPHIFHSYQYKLQLLIEEISEKLAIGSKLLDIGCAQATLSLILAEKGYVMIANDIRNGHLDYARSRYEKGNISFVCENFLDIDYSKQFDGIVLSEVIEHLIEHDIFLEKIHRALKPGGYLFCTTPNQKYLLNRLPNYTTIAEWTQFKTREFSADGDDHFYLFEKQELATLLLKNNFSIIKHQFYNSFVMAGHGKTHYLYRFFSPIKITKLARYFENKNEFCNGHFVVAKKS